MHEVSRAVCSLELMRPTLGTVAKATGFYWRTNGQLYVVTNWHNVTGVDAFTNKLIGDYGCHPTQMRCSHYVLNSAGTGFFATSRVIDLYSNGEPVWLEHALRRAVDCVAVPVPALGEQSYTLPINEIDFTAALPGQVGEECFIVGYPLGLEGPGRTPIWKRGSIANEPQIDGPSFPRYVLVDTATREGMSGSPVIIRHSGFFSETKELTRDGVVGTVENLFGVYSGRLGKDQFGAQLGRVWKIDCVKEIFSFGVNGLDPNYAM